MLLPNQDDDADVSLYVVVTPDVPRSLFLDETYIHRILMNLLSNALKFTRSGYILLLIEMHDDNVVATVKDTGSGVPPSFLPQLFEPFKQAQTKGMQRGTGLGLSITKQLLHQMQGTIEVESRHPELGEVGPGQTGSTFTITIPVQPSGMVTPNVVANKPTSKIAILHGNNERSLEGLCTSWEKFGYDVVVVTEFGDLLNCQWEYIWADLTYLKQNPLHLESLLRQKQWLVLVPYETPSMLQQIPRILSAQHFIPLEKPLIWHTFKQRILVASQPASAAALARTVRFAPKVDILEGSGLEQSQETSTAKNIVILLVEDNPVSLLSKSTSKAVI